MAPEKNPPDQESHVKPHRFDIDGVPHLVAPPGWTTNLCADLGEKPRRIARTVKMAAIDSFLDYCVRYGAPHESALLGSVSEMEVRCVLDYHAWGWHKAIYALRQTPSLRDWLACNGSWLKHKAFGRHVLRHSADITDGPGDVEKAQILEMARTFQVTQQIDTQSAHTLSNGASQFRCDMAVSGSSSQKVGNAQVPEEFQLCFPAFVDVEAHISPTARFEYRAREGELTMRYEILGVDELLNDVLMSVAKAAATKTGLPVYLVE